MFALSIIPSIRFSCAVALSRLASEAAPDLFFPHFLFPFRVPLRPLLPPHCLELPLPYRHRLHFPHLPCSLRLLACLTRPLAIHSCKIIVIWVTYWRRHPPTGVLCLPMGSVCLLLDPLLVGHCAPASGRRRLRPSLAECRRMKSRRLKIARVPNAFVKRRNNVGRTWRMT